MKKRKQRVIALDYFRGICIIAVVLNHAWIFSMPFAYLTGAGGLWTSAAELFFLLSGITLMIVRGNSIHSDALVTAKKIWRRAGMLYVLSILLTSVSILLLFLLPPAVSGLTIGEAPTAHGLRLLMQMLTFHYSVGLASFFMYYSVYLVVAPAVLYAVRTRLWPLVLSASAALFGLYAMNLLAPSVYSSFAIWQLYFVLGMVMARFRLQLAGSFYNLPQRWLKGLSAAVIGAAGASILISALLSFNLFPAVSKLTAAGWLPEKIQGAYSHLLQYQSTLNLLLRDDRMGILRPLATMLIFGAAYLLYQRYKDTLLRRTGSFVNGMGRETLWVFSAQAIVIPVMSAVPYRHNLLTNFLMTLTLMYVMWLVAKRRAFYSEIRRQSQRLYQTGLLLPRYLADGYRDRDNY